LNLEHEIALWEFDQRPGGGIVDFEESEWEYGNGAVCV